MIIIIGLGNPGAQFNKTRHNVGFMAVDRFAQKNNFPEFKLQKKSNSLVSEHVLGNAAVLLAKPQTFMNESGKAVKSLIQNSKEPYGEQATKIQNSIIVVHDDIDLPVGKIKIVKDRGSAGHKGVESIIKNVGNDGLIRFRISIKPEQFRALNHGTKKAKDVVLKKITKEEQKIINETIEKTAEALNCFIKNGLEKTMNEFNS